MKIDPTTFEEQVRFTYAVYVRLMKDMKNLGEDLIHQSNYINERLNEGKFPIINDLGFIQGRAGIIDAQCGQAGTSRRILEELKKE